MYKCKSKEKGDGLNTLIAFIIKIPPSLLHVSSLVVVLLKLHLNPRCVRVSAADSAVM